MNSKQILGKMVGDLAAQLAETQESLINANSEVSRIKSALSKTISPFDLGAAHSRAGKSVHFDPFRNLESFETHSAEWVAGWHSVGRGS